MTRREELEVEYLRRLMMADAIEVRRRQPIAERAVAEETDDARQLIEEFAA